MGSPRRLLSRRPARDVLFGPREDVPVEEAAGRVAAEQITPYPPGIPAVVPGERIPGAIVDYLRSGLNAGMVLGGLSVGSDRAIAVFDLVAATLRSAPDDGRGLRRGVTILLLIFNCARRLGPSVGEDQQPAQARAREGASRHRGHV